MSLKVQPKIVFGDPKLIHSQFVSQKHEHLEILDVIVKHEARLESVLTFLISGVGTCARATSVDVSQSGRLTAHGSKSLERRSRSFWTISSLLQVLLGAQYAETLCGWKEVTKSHKLFKEMLRVQ